jgi:hypothetical protein
MKAFLLTMILGAAIVAALPATAHAQTVRKNNVTRVNNPPANRTAVNNRTGNGNNNTAAQNNLNRIYGDYYNKFYNNNNINNTPIVGTPSIQYGVVNNVPYSVYYGNQPTNTLPHWHTEVNPFGYYNWYGVGPTDYQPQLNINTPYGSTSYYYGYGGWVQSYPAQSTGVPFLPYSSVPRLPY